MFKFRKNKPEQPYVRIEAALLPAAAEVLRTAKVLKGISTTEIVRYAIAAYDAGLQADYAGDRIVAEHDSGFDELSIPTGISIDTSVAHQKLAVNVNKKSHSILQMTQLLTGNDMDTTVNTALLYYGEFAGAEMSGHQLRRVPNPNNPA